MVNTFLNFFLWLPQDSTILVLPNHVTALLPLTLGKKMCSGYPLPQNKLPPDFSA